MADLIATSTRRLILGFGVTGRGVARYFDNMGMSYCVSDTRAMQTQVAEYSGVKQFVQGEPTLELLEQFDEVFVSPGIDSFAGAVGEYRQRGGRVRSDVELFLESFKGRVITITGTNGKSTVTDMTAYMLRELGFNALACGNIGVPVLDVLEENCDTAVVELSSFQLDLLEKVPSDVATILNVSADHLDRYGSLANYHQSKLKIYRGAASAVVNGDDPLTTPITVAEAKQRKVRMGRPDLKEFGVVQSENGAQLFFGPKLLASADEFSLVGKHNLHNIAVAVALLDKLGIAIDDSVAAAKTYAGLPHRCRTVASHQGVSFINDSKATNVAAVEAALAGLNDQPIALLLGGLTKGGDFHSLAAMVKQMDVSVFCFGRDAQRIADSFGGNVTMAANMFDATRMAYESLSDGGVVLLSPGCASMDQFDNFEDRGRQFEAFVNDLVEHHS